MPCAGPTNACWWRCRGARTVWPFGTCSLLSGIGLMACTSAWGSTAIPTPHWPMLVSSPNRSGPHSSRSISVRSSATRFRWPPTRQEGCRVRPAGCPNVTCSIGPQSNGVTLQWPQGTTSTMRRPCCSGTSCGGRSSISAASCRYFPTAMAFPERSSRFLRCAAPLPQAVGDTADHDAHGDVLGRCRSCDVPTDNEVCAFCRLVDRVTVR